jgi:general secretion pathway protein D
MKKMPLLPALLVLASLAGNATAAEETTVTHVVAKGQSLARILRARGVSDREMPRYFDAIRQLNPSIADIERIRPGARVVLPTASRFASAATAAAPAPSEGAAAPSAQAVPAAQAPSDGKASPAANDNIVVTPVPADNTLPAAPAAAPAPAPVPADKPSRPAAESAPQKKAPKSTVFLSMDFTDVDLPVLIKFISEQTRKNFIFDERVTGKITIISPRKVSLDEAYDVFISVLQVKGFTTVEQGNAIKIVPLSAAKQENLPNAKDPDGNSVSEFVTRLIPLQYVDSPDVVALLQPMMSKDGLLTSFPSSNTLILIDSRANIDRLMRILAEIDAEGATSVLRIIPLKYASCVEVGKTLDAIYQETPGTAAPGQPAAARGRRVRTASSKGGHGGGMFKVLSDARTNSVIVLAGKEQIGDIEDLVSRLDIPAPENTGKINLIYLENADAEEMSKVLASLTDKKATPAAAPAAPGQPPSTVKGVISAEFEGGVKITADKATNSLIIIASANDFQTLADIVKKLDIRRRQVYVEGLIMEISLDKARDVGVEFRGASGTGNGGAALTGTNFGFDGGVNDLIKAIASGNPLSMSGAGMIAGGIGGNVTLPDGTKIPAVMAILRAAQSNTNVNILSSPHLLTLDNKEAEIVVGENVPFITSNLTNTTNTSSVTNTVERKDVGVTLRLTPHIHESDFVNLDIYQESSTVKGDSLLNVNQVGPTTTKRSAKTSVIVRSGDTVVLGGMMQETISTTRKQVPLLGDIPLLGWLFKYNSVSRQKTNMLIFLTPRIIKNPQDMTSIAADRQKAMDKFIEQNKDEVERIIPDKTPAAGIK